MAGKKGSAGKLDLEKLRKAASGAAKALTAHAAELLKQGKAAVKSTKTASKGWGSK